MTDVSSLVNDVLKGREVPRIGHCSYSFEQINGFLQDAYTINNRIVELITYIRSIRQPYLSTAPPPRRRLQQDSNRQPTYLTDIQRDQIDAEAKTVLRDLHAAVNILSDAEKTRQKGEDAISEKRRRGRLGALSKWASGGILHQLQHEETPEEAKANGVKAHREGVIWYLQQRLEQCGRLQSSMMRIRLEREVEKSKSVLYKTRGAGPVPVWEDDMLEGGKAGTFASNSGRIAGLSTQEFEKNTTAEDDANDEQMQLFAKENQDILKQYENKMDQVRTAEKSILEIAELQTTLATHLDTQSVMIDQLIQDSFSTTENIGTGNKELKKASERRSTAKMVFYATAGVCSFFVFWDLIV